MTNASLEPGSGLEPSTERRCVCAAWNDWLQSALPRQICDRSEEDGAFSENGDGWHDGRYTAFVLGRLLATRCWAAELELADSVTSQLDDAIRRALGFLERRQDDDGQIDLLGMYSPNEVGFTLPALAEGYERIGRLPGDPLEEIRPGLKNYLLRGAEAVLEGSAYTANHRWAAACAPLAAVHALWPDSRYLAKIEDYLADGIDCDEHGCWHEERSTIYNRVANQGLMVMADKLGRPDLFDHVIRNQKLALYMVQPNGEADSSFSHRQDRGQAGCPAASYAAARRAALVSGDGRLTSLAQLAWRREGVHGELMPLLFELDNHPAVMPEAKPLPDSYERVMPSLGLARLRRPSASLTLSADRGGHFYDSVLDQWGGVKLSDDWFHFHHGDIVWQSLQLAGASLPNMQPTALRRLAEGTYLLKGGARPWIHPLHFRPGKPQLVMERDWRYSARITWKQDRLTVEIDSQSEKHLYGCLKWWFRPGISFREGGESPQEIAAGSRHALRGGQPLRLESARYAMTIHGIPPGAHARALFPSQPIPSATPRTCGVLLLGVRFPLRVRLDLELQDLP